jgi:hypothetical protein
MKKQITVTMLMVATVLLYSGCISFGSLDTVSRVETNGFYDPVTEKLIELGVDKIPWKVIRFEGKKKGEMYIYDMTLRENGSNSLFPEMVYTAKFDEFDLVSFELLIWINRNVMISESFYEIGTKLSDILNNVHEKLKDKLDVDGKYVERPPSRE